MFISGSNILPSQFFANIVPKSKKLSTPKLKHTLAIIKLIIKSKFLGYFYFKLTNNLHFQLVILYDGKFTLQMELFKILKLTAKL